MAIQASKEFPGIAFDYDATKQPFFEALVNENLRLLKKLETGKALLEAIAAAKPGYRLGRLPEGCNVCIQPPLERQYLVPGTRRDGTVVDQTKVDAWRTGMLDKDAKPGGCKLIPTLASKTSVSADCGKAQGAAKYAKPHGDGSGSTCTLSYTNTEILSASGEWFIPHISMGHELIHCLHSLAGVSKWDDKEEEWFTVGIKGFEDATFSENRLRADAGYPLRKKYFKDD